MRILTYRLLLLLLMGILAACNTPTNPPTSTPDATEALEDSPTSEPTEEVTVQFLTSTPLRVAPVESPAPPCSDALDPRMILHVRGRVLSDDPRALNIRAGPGTEYLVLGRIEQNEVFYVLSGPECGNDYAWYLVRYENIEGWVAEGDEDNYYIEPYLPG